MNADEASRARYDHLRELIRTKHQRQTARQRAYYWGRIVRWLRS